MMIEVKYFGILAEASECEHETFDMDSGNLSALLQVLHLKYGLDNYSFQVAVNRRIITQPEVYELKESDEIALLPAFAGG